MFENYFMIITDPADPVRAKGAKRVTLAEARKKIVEATEGTKIFISPGLTRLISATETEFVADLENENSVFEAFI